MTHGHTFRSHRPAASPGRPAGLRNAAAAFALALLLAACGGSDPDAPDTSGPGGAPSTPGHFTSLVSFGDSLSDAGTYAPATSVTANGLPPYFGGKFTTNGATGTIWIENLAQTLGLTITPAEVGFAGSSVACPSAAAPVPDPHCTAYGQGGSRVTDPNGIGHGGGALTVPIVTQISNHLTRSGGFEAGDLVVVYAGNNDVLVQFGGFAAQAAAIQARVVAGELSQEQGNLALFDAQSQAQAQVKTAALALAAAIRDQILGQGARYVAVLGLSDIGDTPFGQSLPATARPVLSDLCRLFNLWLTDGLDDQPVRIIDTFAIAKENYQNPAKYGIENNTVPACDATKISAITDGQVSDGSSLFCNATVGAPYYGLRDGANTTTWQFADGLHPTTIGHKNLSDAVLAQLQAFGWL